MAGTIALVVVVALVTVLLGCGLGYCFAKIKYLTDLQAATREREELQRQLAAAVRTNPAPASQPKSAAANPAPTPATNVALAAAPAEISASTVPPASATVPIAQQAISQQAMVAEATPAPAVQSGPQSGPLPRETAACTNAAAQTAPQAPAQPAASNAEFTQAEQQSSSARVATADATPPAKANTSAPITPGTKSPADPSTTCTLQQLVAETAARAQSDVMCIVDIDFLRQYRERYGRELGDYVSSHVENVIRDTLQSVDAVISRYEGQEFVIAWPSVLGPVAGRLDAARRTAAEIRANVEQAFLQIGSERLTVTVSLGLALCEPNVPGEHVIARADEALVAAKRAGRNCGFYHNGIDPFPILPLTTPSEVPGANGKNKKGDQKKQARRSSSERERRRHERKPCNNINLIAPCTDGILPSIDKFQRVQFFDISLSGFSMVLPAVPTTSHFAVALINSKGTIFMSAEVANVRQAKRVGDNDKPLLIVGCCFRQRLHPQPTVADAPAAAKPATPALAN